jgi:dipeptidyl-peptidase 4
VTSTTTVPNDTFPRQYARTRRFSLGEPRATTMAPDQRVLFLRSRGGSDPVTCLWEWRNGVERLLADPLVLLAGDDGELPSEEKARRERLREQADGITAYATDAEFRHAVFSLQGRLFRCDLYAATTTELGVPRGSFDARLSPDGSHVAYVNGRELRILNTASNTDVLLAADDAETVSWGSPDFIAAEELNRFRGYWWSPDGTQIVAARVDEAGVALWHIADPAHPDQAPRSHRYPAAGTANAHVSLHILSVQGAPAIDPGIAVSWDLDAYPYVVDVRWTDPGGITLVVTNREQNRQLVLGVDPTTGTTTTRVDLTDPAWVELLPGTPTWLDGDRLLHSIDCHVDPTGLDPDGTRALVVHQHGTVHVVSSANLQIHRVVATEGDDVLLVANASLPIAGLDVPVGAAHRFVAVLNVATGALRVIAGGIDDPGVHDVTGTPTNHVVRSASLTRMRAGFRVVLDGVSCGEIVSFAEVAVVQPNVTLLRSGVRNLNTALLLPDRPRQPGERLPVLLDPYAGPHAQRVVASRNAHTTSQWFANQGYAVVVIDGRGTPGVGPVFERALFRDLATVILDDQIDGLHDVAARNPELDLTRVAIRGWSFGGYLAALAVLRRPDVFHAAIAGAPVTDWRLYDTAYSERYLGNPTVDAGPYDVSSLLLDAPKLIRPLQLIHGLADDNVVAAHTLQLSSALLAAGRPHEVLPLTGVTHMTPQEEVAENLLLLQVDFLRRALATTP